MSKERIAALDSIGVCWGSARKSWDEMFGRLMEYKNETGNVKVPTVYQKDLHLGNWVHNLGQMRKCDRLPEERYRQLDAIGFDWSVRETNWYKLYDRLVAYKAEFGNLDVPTRYDRDQELGTWVGNQRQLSKNDKINDE